MHLVIHPQLQESPDHCTPFMLCHIFSFLTQQIPQSLRWLLCSSSLVQTRHYQQQHRVQLTAGCLPCWAVPAVVVVVLPARNALSAPPSTSSHAGHKSAITTVWPDRGSNMAATRSQQHPASTTTPSCCCSSTRCTIHDFVVIVIKLSNSDHGQ